MHPTKIVAIANWEESHTVDDVRVFLGLANYYRRFIEGSSKIVAPLKDLLKKERTRNWTEKSNVAFAELKRRIVSAWC